MEKEMSELAHNTYSSICDLNTIRVAVGELSRIDAVHEQQVLLACVEASLVCQVVNTGVIRAQFLHTVRHHFSCAVRRVSLPLLKTPGTGRERAVALVGVPRQDSEMRQIVHR